MTIASTIHRQTYTGTGTATTFPLGFRVLSAAHLEVTRTVGAVTTTLALGTDYNVTGTGGVTDASVVLTTPLALDAVLRVRRVVPVTQPTDIRNQGAFLPSIHEDALDRLVMIDQQQAGDLDRALHLRELDTDGSGAYDANGNRITDLGSPTAASDAVSQAWVQSYVGGITPPVAAGASLVTATGGTVARTLADRSGEWVNVRDFGAVGTGLVDDTAAFHLAIAACPSGGTVYMPRGTYAVNVVCSKRVGFSGDGMGATTVLSATASGWAITLTTRNPDWNWMPLRRFTVAGTGSQRGIRMGGDAYVADDELTGRFRFEEIAFAAPVGLLKQDGNIGNQFVACNFTGGLYHVYAWNRTGVSMHGGNDLYAGCHFASAQRASLYYDTSVGGPGQVVLRDPVFEFMAGFALYIRSLTGTFAPGLVIDSAWFESVGTATTTPISFTGPDGATTDVTTRQMYLRSCRHASVSKSVIGSVELSAATLVVDDLSTFDGADNIVRDAASSVVVRGAASDRVSSLTYQVDDPIYMARSAGNFASRMLLAPRIATTSELPTGTVVHAVSGDALDTYAFSGTASVDAVKRPGGRTFDQCLELTVGAGATCLDNSATGNFTLAADRYVVWTLDARLVSGTLNSLSIQGDTFVLASDFKAAVAGGRWVTIGGITNTIGLTPGAARLTAVNGGGGAVLRFGAYQVVAFTDLNEAVHFLRSRTFVAPTRPRIGYGAAAPTTGAWVRGDVVYHNAPAAATTPGWVCVSSGMPGIWKALGVLAS